MGELSICRKFNKAGQSVFSKGKAVTIVPPSRYMGQTAELNGREIAKTSEKEVRGSIFRIQSFPRQVHSSPMKSS